VIFDCLCGAVWALVLGENSSDQSRAAGLVVRATHGAHWTPVTRDTKKWDSSEFKIYLATTTEPQFFSIDQLTSKSRN
jgi:hypothetical protein